MTKQPVLKVRKWDKSESEWALLDWLPHKGAAIVLDPEGTRKVLSFVLSGHPSPSVTRLALTFPIARPIGIEEICLTPPPCRATQDDADMLREKVKELSVRASGRLARARTHASLWEIKWLRDRDQILVPLPEDKPELFKILETFKAEKTREYTARRAELGGWVSKSIGEMLTMDGGLFYRLINGRLVGCGSFLSNITRNPKSADHRHPLPSIKEQAKEHLERLENTFKRPATNSKGCPSAGYLNWNIEIARYEPAIRNQVLHARWAREEGIDLSEMSLEKQDFLVWYRAMFPYQIPPKPRYPSAIAISNFPPEYYETQANDELCAEVHFRVRFEDHSCIWLADLPTRHPLLTPGEQYGYSKPGLGLFGLKTNVHLEKQPLPGVRSSRDDGSGALSANSNEVAPDIHPAKYSPTNVCEELRCKPKTLRQYCDALDIDMQSIGKAELAAIKHHRETLKRRPHLKVQNRTRHGLTPKRRGRNKT